MSAREGRPERSTAWDHFRRTGVILPNRQAEIAARLAARAAEATDEGRTDERRPIEA